VEHFSFNTKEETADTCNKMEGLKKKKQKNGAE
jgi:hypothetical protein